jgi:putative photosynthetic complex assembly protein 2
MGTSTTTTAATVEVTRRPALRAFGRAAVMVTLFWWLATGVIFMAQRQGTAALVGTGLSTLLLGWSLWTLVRTREQLDTRGATLNFLAGGLAWAWVTTVFLAGYIVGPPVTEPIAEPGSWAMALDAIHATLYSDVTGLLMLAAVALATGHGSNRVGLWTYMVFWGAQQSAKLNIFFGVVNPGDQFFPPHLEFLVWYFGPRENQWLVYASVLLLGSTAWWSGREALRARSDYPRIGCAVMATLLGLAALEHVVLALPLSLPLWEIFLDWRGR